MLRCSLSYAKVRRNLFFLYIMGGGIFRVTIVCTYFFDVCQSRRGLAMVSSRQQSYGLAAKKLWHDVKRIFFFTTQNEYSFERDLCST